MLPITERSLKKSKKKKYTETNDKENTMGFFWWLSGKECTCQHRRHEFDPQFGIPHAPQQLGQCPTTIGPVLLSPVSLLLKPVRLEPVLHNQRSNHS